MYYYLSVEKVSIHVEVEMEDNFRNGQGSDIGAIGKLYVPIDLGRYPLPAEEKSPYRVPFKNDLANHIFDSIDQRFSENKHKGSIDEIFEDRLTLIRSKIELLVLQMGQRKKINEKILYRIDYDSCQVQNMVHAMGIDAYRISGDRVNIEKIKLDLETQKRREEKDYFGDTSLLNRELREALIQYQDEVQKSALIAEMEDKPC